MSDIGAQIDLIGCGMKAAQWEKAKGELRALVMLSAGLQPSQPKPVPLKPEKWERLERAVDAFIAVIEDGGLHE